MNRTGARVLQPEGRNYNSADLLLLSIIGYGVAGITGSKQAGVPRLLFGPATNARYNKHHV